MKIREITQEDKNTVASLVVEFGGDFLENSNEDIIGLHGCDCEVMDFFQEELGSYLLKKGKNTRIMQNGLAKYNIDIGFFLRGPGYYKGLNKDIEEFNN